MINFKYFSITLTVTVVIVSTIIWNYITKYLDLPKDMSMALTVIASVIIIAGYISHIIWFTGRPIMLFGFILAASWYFLLHPIIEYSYPSFFLATYFWQNLITLVSILLGIFISVTSE